MYPKWAVISHFGNCPNLFKDQKHFTLNCLISHKYFFPDNFQRIISAYISFSVPKIKVRNIAIGCWKFADGNHNQVYQMECKLHLCFKWNMFIVKNDLLSHKIYTLRQAKNLMCIYVLPIIDYSFKTINRMLPPTLFLWQYAKLYEQWQ